jgi:hypothetical protein
MIFGSKSIEYSYAHTRRGIDKIDRFVENIGDIQKLEVQLTEQLHKLQRYYVPEAYMLAILCKAFDVKASQSDLNEKPKKVENLKKFRKRAQDLTRSYFSGMGSHGYAALNVLTDYATKPKGVIAPEASMHSLQQKCGNWMDDFITSIQSPAFSFDQYLEDYLDSAETIKSL